LTAAPPSCGTANRKPASERRSGRNVAERKSPVEFPGNRNGAQAGQQPATVQTGAAEDRQMQYTGINR